MKDGGAKNLFPRHWVSFGDELEEHVQLAGPANWLPWTLAFRNTLIHRGRRLKTPMLQRGAVLVDSRQQPILSTRLLPMLPAEPGFSDVEAFALATGGPMLKEEARRTMDGVLKALQRILGQGCAALLPIWERRASEPTLILQPEAQWKNIPASDPLGFNGFDAGRTAFKADAMIGADETIRRFQAAALTDDAKLWK